MKRDKGISLVVLVITIVVIMVISSTVIVNLVNTNLVNNTNNAVLKQNISNMKDSLHMYIMDEYADTQGEYESDKLNANNEGAWYGSQQLEGNMESIVGKVPDKLQGKVFVEEGKLVADMLKITTEEKEIFEELGVEVKVNSNVDIGKINIVPSTSDWTGSDVGVIISYTKEIPEGYAIEYKINAGKWQEGTQVTVEENNTKVTARLYSKEKDNEAVTNSYTVSNIDKENPTEPTNIEITVGTNSVIATASGATDSLSGLEKYQYSIDNINWQDDGTFSGYKNATEVTVYAKAIDKVGNESVSISDKGTTTAITAPILNLVNNEWTKDDVIASVTGTAPEGYVLQYKLSGGMTKDWTTYTGNVTINVNNTTMVARYYNASVDDEIASASKTASKIDKFAPDIANMKISITATTNSITAVASGAIDTLSGNVTYKYSLDNTTWQDSGTYSGYKNATEVTVYAKAIDKVGNESASVSDKGTTTVITAPILNLVNNEWTKDNVIASVTGTAPEGYVLEYKLSGGMTKDWTTYTGNVTINVNNTTMVARYYNASVEDEIDSASKTASKIDKFAPDITAMKITLVSTANSVTATASGATDNLSGNITYKYSIDNATWQDSGTFSEIKSGTETTVYAKAIDKVGNESASISNKGTTSSVGAVTITQSPAAGTWTNGNVSVTLSHAAVSGYTLQYKIGTGAWTNYSSELTISANNTTVAARMYNASVDDEGNSANSRTISNIDKVVPTNTAYAGTMLYVDPTFASGVNSTHLYNNLGNGNVTVTRKAMSDSPTGSGYGLEIKTTGTASPGHGGFTFATGTAANKILVTRIVAKIPSGLAINFASNAYGTGSTAKWLTSNIGTGNWQEYAFVVECSSTGTFNSTNYFYLTGGTASTTNPITWQVAYATVIDATRWGKTNYIVYAGQDNESKIVGHGINTSNTTQPTFTAITENANLAKMSSAYSENGTYYTWLKDKAGNVSNVKVVVGYVDTTAPSKPTSVSITVGTNSVTATAIGSTDSQSGFAKYQYSLNNSTWQDSGTFSGIKSGTETTVYARAVDNAGNVSSSISNKGTTSSIGAVTITQNPEAGTWTNGNVTVTLSHAAVSGYTLQYKIGTGAWTNYSSALTITSNNTTVAARMYNATLGDEGNSANSKAISNIDKAAPVVGTLSYSAVNCTTTNLVLASATDDLSKISKIIWYYKTPSATSYTSTTTTYSTSVSSITANTSKQITVTYNTNYSAYAEVYDVVGNKATTSVITVKGNTTHNATTGGALKTAATCTTPAEYYHKCSRCSTQLTTTYTSGNSNGHTSVNGGTSSIHTKCSVCGVTISSTHSYTSSVQTAATCTTKGTTKYTCACGYSYTSQNIATIAHTYSSKTVNSTYLRSNATCTAAATYYYKCTGCSAKGTTYYSNGSALGHYDSNPNYAYNSTYHIYGYCDRCNCEMINSTTAGNTKHTYSSKTVNSSYLRSNATCTAAATYYYKCTGCASKGTTYYSNGSALGHSYSSSTVTKSWTVSQLGGFEKTNSTRGAYESMIAGYKSSTTFTATISMDVAKNLSIPYYLFTGKGAYATFKINSGTTTTVQGNANAIDSSYTASLAKGTNTLTITYNNASITSPVRADTLYFDLPSISYTKYTCSKCSGVYYQ